MTPADRRAAGVPGPSGTWLRWVHAAIYAGATLVGVSTLSPAPLPALAAVAAAVGAFLASWPLLDRMRYRAFAVVLVLGLLLGGLVPAWLRHSDLLAAGVGAADMVLLTRGAQWALWALTLAFCLRGVALRMPSARSLELLFIGLACGQPLVGHRGGAINRPFELSDAVLASGNDPTLVFMLVGALVAGLVIVLFVAERRPLRALGQVALVIGLLGLLFSLAPVPEPDPVSLLSGGQGKQPPAKDKGSGGQGEEEASRRPSKDEELEFRDDYDSSGQHTPLAVVLLHEDYSPPNGSYYFRQTAFSQFNGRRLTAATARGIDTDVATGFSASRVQLDPMAAASPHRIEVESTVALLAEHSRPFALETVVGLLPATNPDPGRFRRVYRARSAVMDAEFGELLELASFDPSWSQPVRDHYVEVPADSRYRELAAEILKTIPAPLRALPVPRALAVSRWLSEHGIYSLKSKHAHAEDPTADFLFGDITGYCVHFAHAAVYLMRALGVPARVGAGYVIEESARQGGSALLLTGANAHAWPEVHVDGVGWLVVDVAPEQALDSPPPPPDPDLQRLLGELARGMRPLPAAGDNVFTPVVSIAARLLVFLRWLGTVGVPLLLVGLYLLKMWRRLAPRFASDANLPRAAYRAQLDRLAELSMRRRYGESREAFAQRLAARLPAFSTLTAWHAAATYRPGDEAPERHRVGAVRARAAAELSGVVPGWRRALGYLDPIAFLFAR